MNQVAISPIKAITQKAILLSAMLGALSLTLWKWLAPADTEIRNLITIPLTAMLLAPITILAAIFYFGERSSEKIFNENANPIPLVVLLVASNFLAATIVSHLFGTPFSMSPTGYFLAFLACVINGAIFLFNLSEIRDQLESRSLETPSWANAFLLLSAADWFLIVIFFFLGRSRRD